MSKTPDSNIELSLIEYLESIDVEFDHAQEIVWRFTEATLEIIAERGLKELCWTEKPGEYLACDRAKGHKGVHSWQLSNYKKEEV